MKLVVLCNSEGEITRVASMPDGAPPLSFQNHDPRYQEVVIQVQDITNEMPGAEVISRLQQIRDRQRVDITNRTLAPK